MTIRYTYQKPLLDWLFDRSAEFGSLAARECTATVLRAAEAPYTDADGFARIKVIHPGTRVRIWMVSRFGDAGITDDLSAECCGYEARVSNQRNQGPLESWLGDIEIK